MQEILTAVQNMNADLLAVNNRMQKLEKDFQDIQKVNTQLTKVVSRFIYYFFASYLLSGNLCN